jgi:dolichol-phosphate mannosyltransferase
MRTLVAVPTYLEAENITELLRRLRAAVPDADVLVIDDNSPDGTADLARAAGRELGQIDLLERPAKAGLGTAYREAFTLGVDRGYDVIVQMDADLSHDPAALPTLLQGIDGGADMVIGSRYVPGGSIPNWPLHRRSLSRYGNRYASWMLSFHVADATSGYRAYRGDMLKRLDPATFQARGYLFQIELAYRVWNAGGTIAEVPIIFTDRVRGHSKMSIPIIVEELTQVSWWGVRDRVLRRQRK